MSTELDCLIKNEAGEVVAALNRSLAVQQKLSQAEVDVLKYLHAGKDNVMSQMKATDDKHLLKMFGKMITLIEFELQRVWKFPLDEKFHRFWYVPKCTCPKMDNDDRYPSGHYVINLSCPVHGDHK